MPDLAHSRRSDRASPTSDVPLQTVPVLVGMIQSNRTACMTQWHSTNAHSIRAHARVALAVCLLGKSKVQAQWPFLFAPLLRRLCGRCFTGANLTLTWARLQNGRAYGSGSSTDLSAPKRHFRFAPESGPRRLGGPCRFLGQQRKWPTCSGRDVRFIARPPAQSRTGGFPAYGSHLGVTLGGDGEAITRRKIIFSFVYERRWIFSFWRPDAASLGHFPFEAFPNALGSQPKFVASFQA